LKWDISAVQRLANEGKIRGYKVIGKQEEEKPKTSKYRSQKTSSDGIVFDSKKEACRYGELKFLQKLGEISDFELQPMFQLSVCKYFADFRYKDKSGMVIVEDVKSKRTRVLPAYRIKCKMMKNELGITIKEV